MNLRYAAVMALTDLLKGKGSLSSSLPVLSQKVAPEDRALLQELCFGTCRHYPQLSAYLEQLLDKPLRAKDADITATLLVGAYQLLHTRIPDHAALSETVDVTKLLKKPWATKLVNGVLRQLQREQPALAETLADARGFNTNLPAWLDGMLRKVWGKPELGVDFATLASAMSSHPPMTLRINTRKISREDYLAKLAHYAIAATATPYSPYGITLAQACDPRDLPDFAEGWVSVQDEAAQLACDLVNAQPSERILDACAAPGGKTGHLLEQTDNLLVTALDLEERRLVRVRENLARLNLSATIVQGDATQPAAWWDGEQFDRILLDAPCSATGIIRRHPDIKVLRTPEDIARLAALQLDILRALWPLLAPGGTLVYATCSIMPHENTRAIAAFLQETPSASEHVIDADWGIAQPHGRQLFAQDKGHDGFYYARLTKAL